MPDELWTEVHDIVQERRIKTIPKKKKRSKKQRRKGKIKHLNVEFHRIARRDKKAFLSNQCKEIDENNRIGKTRNLFKKLELSREHFTQR